jgi:hypothetical protein
MRHRRASGARRASTHYGASLAALKEAEQIRKLIADLDRLLQIITCDIATEEERARVIAQMPPIRSSLGYWQRAATILGTPSLLSNSDFRVSRRTPSSSPSWHKKNPAAKWRATEDQMKRGFNKVTSKANRTTSLRIRCQKVARRQQPSNIPALQLRSRAPHRP